MFFDGVSKYPLVADIAAVTFAAANAIAVTSVAIAGRMAQS